MHYWWTRHVWIAGSSEGASHSQCIQILCTVQGWCLVSGAGRAGTITRVTGLVVPRDTVALVSILYLQTLTHGNQVIWSWILHWRLVPMSGFFYFDNFLPSHSHYLLQCYFFSRLSCVRMTHLKDWIRPWILSMWDPPFIMVAHNPVGGH